MTPPVRPSDGETAIDIQGAAIGTADAEILLRAERDGQGSGRTYTLTYTATDGGGNVVTSIPIATVPPEIGGVVEPLIVVTTEGTGGTVLLWDAVLGALFYNVARGAVGNIDETHDFIDLRTVDCIAAATTQTDTIGFDDPGPPPPGEAFICLVEYNDGLSSGLGTESALKERVVLQGSGDCPLSSGQ